MHDHNVILASRNEVLVTFVWNDELNGFNLAIFQVLLANLLHHVSEIVECFLFLDEFLGSHLSGSFVFGLIDSLGSLESGFPWGECVIELPEVILVLFDVEIIANVQLVSVVKLLMEQLNFSCCFRKPSSEHNAPHPHVNGVAWSIDSQTRHFTEKFYFFHSQRQELRQAVGVQDNHSRSQNTP